MDDLHIVSLYLKRDEQALKETDDKYRRLCFSIAKNILADTEDCRECVNDTYMAVWNSIPPN
ncbi:MAG: sigma-70 family RNA polymerase sigma factor, partial [Oscillospiraceae bacterium]|nr:sigma-70 family RNA polymerase sigma factor [Oscillospiraceae bacterium]